MKGRPVAKSSMDLMVLPKAMLSFHFMLIWKHHLEALTMGHSGRLHMLDRIRRVDKAYRLLCLGAACSHSFCATDSAFSCGVAPRVLTVGEAKGNSWNNFCQAATFSLSSELLWAGSGVSLGVLAHRLGVFHGELPFISWWNKQQRGGGGSG